MSDVSLVQITAYRYKPGDVCQYIDEHDLYSVDVEDEANVTSRPATREERELFPRPLLNGGTEPPDKIWTATRPFWGFEAKAIGDWIGTYSSGVDMQRDGVGNEELQEDVPQFVAIAERKAAQSEPYDNFISFIVAYEFEYGGSYNDGDGDCWNTYLGEVDMNRIKSIIVEAPDGP